jgi:hypothetical protein
VSTSDDLDNAVQAALGPRFSVSMSLEQVPLGRLVHLTVSFKWWALPLWWIRRRGVYALLRALVPEGTVWTLAKRVRW